MKNDAAEARIGRSAHVEVEQRGEAERRVQAVSQRAQIVLFIVDRNGAVVLNSVNSGDQDLESLLTEDGKLLRDQLDVVVRRMIAENVEHDDRLTAIGYLDSERFARLTRLAGDEQPFFAVSVEYFRGRDSLSRAARKYSLTPREVDVLALLLEGASASETASALNIAETTAQGYVKRLLAKTNARNRPAMVATVLDWSGGESRKRR